VLEVWLLWLVVSYSCVPEQSICEGLPAVVPAFPGGVVETVLLVHRGQAGLTVRTRFGWLADSWVG